MDDKIKQLISAYIDGQVTEEERQLVEDQLLHDKSCQTYYKELTALSTHLKTWDDESLSADLQANLQKKLTEAKKMNTKHSIISRPVFGGGVLVTLLICALVAHNYAQRSFQSSVRDASQFTISEKGRWKSVSDDIGDQFAPTTPTQYEPYYLSSDYSVSRPTKIYRSVRSSGSYQKSDYNKFASSAESTSRAYPQEKVAARGAYVMDAKFKQEADSSFLVRADNEFWGDRRVIEGQQVQSYEIETESYVDEVIYQPVVIRRPVSTEQYDSIYENQLINVAYEPLSTFSIDVDNASYTNIRRFLNNNQLPPADAVRIEEMINYFTYDYPQPGWGKPFSITTYASTCPWNPNHQLVQIGIQGKSMDEKHVPKSNLVFLIDVSGSMASNDKLPLLQQSLNMMVDQLSENERVAIVVYAGNAGLVLNSTPGSDKWTIKQAINNLSAGGSTAGGAGIQLAYSIAQQNFINGGNNRVILATDGDFNVGVSSDNELVSIIESKRHQGIFLTVLGFGTGNLKDSKMEKIADKGNGNYFYIDTLNEGRKVLVQELGSTLFTIAKDVKLQVEFNPQQVKAYRLIGYENRTMAAQDFNDDTKDAGELGAGHTVTALYEIVPNYPFNGSNTSGVDPLKYQTNNNWFVNGEMLTVKLRYKDPNGSTSKLIKHTVNKNQLTNQPHANFRFASAVAEFGLLLRQSQFNGYANYDHVLTRARSALHSDPYGYKSEFISLVKKAKQLDQRPLIYTPQPQEWNQTPNQNTTIQFKNQGM